MQPSASTSVERATSWTSIRVSTLGRGGHLDLRFVSSRVAVVFAVGALDAYLSDVSADVMIFQCQQGLVGGDTRAIMRAINQQLPGLALELSVVENHVERMDRIRTAITDHFTTSVSGHGPEAVARAVERMGGKAADLWKSLTEDGFDEPAASLAEWTDNRHRIVHRGEKVSVTWRQGRECLALLHAISARVDGFAMSATELGG
jgi:hypothetical protein